MLEYSPASHRAIVLVDIADFTNPVRTELHKLTMHNGLYDVVRTAFNEANIGWESCDHEDRGDGMLILLPPDCPKIRLADQLGERLVAGLLRYNAVHANPAAIQLRVALHAGEVRLGPNGKVGDAINFTARILDAEEAKKGLRQSSGVLVVIASDTFYQDVIATDPATGSAYFRRIPVAVKRTRDIAWMRIYDPWSQVAEESAVWDVLPDAELELLRPRLADLAIPQLQALVSRSTSIGARPMRHVATAWEALQYLKDYNAGPDGFPPTMAFVELLSRHVENSMAAELTEWNDRQARRLRLTSTLDEWRAANSRPTSARSQLYLVIRVEHDGLDPDTYLVSHWRQDDPENWPPPHGGTRTVEFEELEREVDDIVVGAEAAWAGYQGDSTIDVVIEFVLPRSLLNVPLHLWQKEYDSGDPRPLSLDYPIVVRSLERMMSKHWHRPWLARWKMLMEHPEDTKVYFSDPTEMGGPYDLDLALKDPQRVLMVLSEPPPPEVRPHDELSAALRSGLPAVLWNCGDRTTDEMRTLVTHLAVSDGLADLPQRTLSARQAAFAGSPDKLFDPQVVHNLVVLWDDPRRLVDLDQPPRSRRPKGGTADERERAS